MPGNTWSGPGRALQAHLDLFGYVDRAHDWIAAHADRGVTQRQIERGAPSTLRQRLRLMTSMALTVDSEGIVNGVSTATQRSAEDALYSPGNVARGVGLVNQEWDILNRGETHYVSRHIMIAVEAAAEQAGDEPLFPTDLPCPQGLIVFEYPLIIPDLDPQTGDVVPGLAMPVRAIAWGQNNTIYSPFGPDGQSVIESGIGYSLYTDEDAWRTLFLTSIERCLPDEWANYQTYYEGLPSDRDRLWCIDTSAWSYARSWYRSHDLSPATAIEKGEIHSTVATVRRFLLALWRFCWQRILVPETYRPSRPERRRMERVGLPTLDDGYVKVLRLRRVVEAEARGETVDPTDRIYDHSWIVRGHPRRQWFPSLGPARNEDGTFNHDSHRLIWIEPFVKGDGPLVVGHAVTAVVR